MRKLTADWLASLPEGARREFLDGLSPNAQAALPWLFSVWAHRGHQLPPEGAWHVWVILGGRGAGKTRAGAEWVRAQVEGPGPQDPGRCRRVCLLGETIEQVRGVMVEGESGLLACSPPDRRPDFKPSLNRVVWPNGAEAWLVSAANPEALRGPQFDCAWSDELAKWRRGREAWDMLQFCMRLGDDPRQIVTTTPRDNDLLREILEAPGTVSTHAGTEANRAHLAPGFLDRLEGRYGGTSLGRQELDGVLLEATDGALWTRAGLEALRVAATPRLDRIVVAVDPPASVKETADECGIVVVGARLRGEWGDHTAYVLEDASARGLSPKGWAERAAEAYDVHGADRMIAEANQGGAMVESVLRQVAPNIAYRKAHATQGKRARAEPVAALYEQGRVHHVGRFDALEDQMCRFTGARDGIKSPDRLDALVWAIDELILKADRPDAMRVRRL
ncbi:MAG: terminase family protein [Pseudomonadota bacterium]